MKKSVIIAGVAGMVILGGAVGAGAVSNSAPNVEKSAAISEEKAKEIAIKETGATFKSIELDKEDGRLIYEIDLVNGNEEVDVDIDATTGNVIKAERDLHDDDDESIIQSDSTPVKFTEKEAVAIAIKDTPGTVTDTEFDAEDHSYEIEIKTAQAEVEIKVDANSGKIVEKELDRD
ncbi:PepSY domain-containing protein [Lederbergia citrea]|uniref:PepSY domain-containing protein n=1 Tax=Lederbergia citrea TaxID=2833581 RepID=A0A942Z2X4_9BACI|nr:PepSY domain-containing protein [Lederbergia citrea]MBS4222988.1 PepSY domain-containing protein [Lederbergia citrea]